MIEKNEDAAQHCPSELQFARPDNQDEPLDPDTEALLSQLSDEPTERDALAVRAARALRNSKQFNTFPCLDVSEIPVVDDLHGRMSVLAEDLAKHGDYAEVRAEYCRLSLLMNLEGVLAPAFRPALFTGKKKGDDVFNKIHRDQIVIDCHWLHSTKQSIVLRPKDIEYKPLFCHDRAFPIALAWDFAKEKWKSDHRVVDMLRLTRLQQIQLLALRESKLKCQVESIEKGSRKDGHFRPAPLSLFIQGLNAWCERDRRIYAHRRGYEAVWRAAVYLGASASMRQIGELASLMQGLPQLDDKTIRCKLKNIQRHILDYVEGLGVASPQALRGDFKSGGVEKGY